MFEQYIDEQRLDYTGHGPTGAGGAPTESEKRRQSMNRFHSGRVIDAMQYIDPYITGIGMASQQLLSGSNDPAEARRSLYGTAGGQAALDGLMATRRAGLLGQGDPVNYANNVVRGITSGGFTADITGGGMMGLGQRVSGNGMLSERVSMNYAQGLMTDLYGKGTPDPSKLHGFNMEEASGVFATIASRGGVGKAASWRKNADTQTRIDAARDAAVDPEVKAMLEKTTASSDEEMNGLIEAQSDPKLKEELKRIQKSTDAIVVNSEGRRAVAETVREVTKGMAALSDIYGELSAPQLQQQLESVTGKKITNRAQAKAATNMVESLRGTADMNGIDPRAFMDYAQGRQASMYQQTSAALGLDERSASMLKEINANVANTTLLDAGSAAKVSQETAVQAREMGFGDIQVRTVDEIALDKEQGRIQAMSKYKGSTMLRGYRDKMKGESRAKADDLMERIDSTEDPEERAKLEQEARVLMGKTIGGESGWFGAEHSGTGARAITNAFRGQNGKDQEKFAISGRTNAINQSAMIDSLTSDGMDEETAKDVSDKILRNVGASGLMALAELDRTPADRRKRKVDSMVEDAGMSGKDATQFREQLEGVDVKALAEIDQSSALSSDERRTKKIEQLKKGGMTDAEADQFLKKSAGMDFQALADVSSATLSPEVQRQMKVDQMAAAKGMSAEDTSTLQDQIAGTDLKELTSVDDSAVLTDEGKRKAKISQLTRGDRMTEEAAATFLDQTADMDLKGLSNLKETTPEGDMSPEAVHAMKVQKLTKEMGLSHDVALDYLENSKNMNVGDMVEATASTDREGVAKYDTERRAQASLDAMGSDTRTRIQAGDNEVSINSITTALSRGTIKDINDPESMALALQAMADEGMSTEVDQLDADGRVAVDAEGNAKKIKLSDHVKTDMDMSKGMTPEVMKSLQELNGGKAVGLAKKLGYESDEEMAKATADSSEARLEAITMLKTDEEFMSLNVSGNEKSMTGMTDEALHTARQGQMPQTRLNTLATARSLFPAMSEDEQNAMTQSIKDGGKIDTSQFWAGGFDGKVEGAGGLTNWGGDWDDESGRKYVKIENSDRMARLGGTVDGANEQQMAGLTEINKDGGLVKQMESQAVQWRAAMDKAGGTATAVSTDASGNKVTTELTAEFMKKFDASIEKLRGNTNSANGLVAEMRVTNLHVDHIPDNKK